MCMYFQAFISKANITWLVTKALHNTSEMQAVLTLKPGFLFRVVFGIIDLLHFQVLELVSQFLQTTYLGF